MKGHLVVEEENLLKCESRGRVPNRLGGGKR